MRSAPITRIYGFQTGAFDKALQIRQLFGFRALLCSSLAGLRLPLFLSCNYAVFARQ